MKRSRIRPMVVLALSLTIALPSAALLAADSGKSEQDWKTLKKESKRLIAALASLSGGKVQLLVAVTPPLTKEGWDAREIFLLSLMGEIARVCK